MRKIIVRAGVVEAIAYELTTPTFNVEAALAGDARADSYKEIRALALAKYKGVMLSNLTQKYEKR